LEVVNSTVTKCNGIKVIASFKYYPQSGAILFTQTFPDGVFDFGGHPNTQQHQLQNPIATETHDTAANCTVEMDKDYHGNDLRYVSNVTDVGVCCSLCQQEPKCVGFSLMGAADKHTAWADRCYLKTSMKSGETYKTHISGKVPGRTPSPQSTPELSVQQVTGFPLWRNPLGSDVGYLTWGERNFFPAKYSVGSPSVSPSGAPTSGSGVDSVPIVIYKDRIGGAGGVLSTYDEHFTSVCVLSNLGFGAGISSKVTQVEPGYENSFLLILESGGVTNVTMTWGATFQKAFATVRWTDTDVVTTKLGYWTDNQAYYDWYHWFPNVDREGKPQDVILALDHELTSKNLSVHYYQFDAYWYKLEIDPGYCIVDWTAVSNQFPKGLEWLSTQLKKPLMLYTDTWCKDNVYDKRNGGNFTFMDGDQQFLSWFKGNTSNVVPEESLAFYRAIMKQGKAQGMGFFEVDFLNFNMLIYPRFRSEPGAHAMWLKGMNDAAVEAEIPIQYCMALPQQILNAVTLGAVTNARVSGDGGRPYFNGAIGHLLAAAVGIRPFKDNTWTSGEFPKGEADLVGSVLSMGPVGLADQLNKTVASIAATSCSLDGTLLHPSRPATPIDRTFLSNTFTGSVISANSGPKIGGQNWYLVAASGWVDANTTVTLSDMWPVPLPSVKFVWWQRHSSGCVAGGTVSACVHTVSDQGFTVTAAKSTIKLYNIAPVLSNGFVLLGETSKVVPVSANRITTVTVMTGSVDVEVVASNGEVVELLFVSPSSSNLASKSVTITASGTATISLV